MMGLWQSGQLALAAAQHWVHTMQKVCPQGSGHLQWPACPGRHLVPATSTGSCFYLLPLVKEEGGAFWKLCFSKPCDISHSPCVLSP